MNLKEVMYQMCGILFQHAVCTMKPHCKYVVYITALGGLSSSVLLVIMMMFYCTWQYSLPAILTFMLDKFQA